MTLTYATQERTLGSGRAARRQARGHSRLVHLLRWSLPLALFSVVCTVGGYVAVDAMHAAAARPEEGLIQIRMSNPHFLGRDDKGRVFDLSARQAARDDRNLQRVLLTAPVIVMTVVGEGRSTLTADHGVYREDTRMLQLQGHVRVDDSKSSTLSTNDALVDTRAGTVTGISRLAANGPQGAISAGSYAATNHGDRVVLRGGVRGSINGGAQLFGAPAPGSPQRSPAR